MKKLIFSLAFVSAIAFANAQTKVELTDFNSKAESLVGQSVTTTGYVVEIGKDGKTAMVSSSATASKPEKGQGKPEGRIIRVKSSSEINSSLKGQSVTVTGTVAEDKAPMNNGKDGKGCPSDSTKCHQPNKKGNVSDTTSRPKPPTQGEKGKHNHYIIDNATISKN